MAPKWRGLSSSLSNRRTRLVAVSVPEGLDHSAPSGAISVIRYRAVVSYDGTDFLGFQSQEHADREVRTVQSVLQVGLSQVIGRRISIVGAGRTDAGVHASGQVIHFECASTRQMSTAQLERALNAVLPRDLRVFGLVVVSDGFHARFSATRRSYRYVIDNGRYAHPQRRRYAWHVASVLDISAMRAACLELVGLHDFVAFAAREASGPTVRRVYRADVIEIATHDAEALLGDRIREMWHNKGYVERDSASSGRVIWIEVEANAFLRHMMRRIVGSLVRVGRGWMPPAEVGELLRSRVKADAGPAAPAHGLDLFHIAYGDTNTVDQD